MEQKSKGKITALGSIFTVSVAVVTMLGHAQKIYFNAVLFDQISAVALIIIVTAIIYLFYRVKLIDDDISNCVKQNEKQAQDLILDNLTILVASYAEEKDLFESRLEAIDAKLDQIILSFTSLTSSGDFAKDRKL